ncbi:AAA family ATPase [Candidatus Enterococcus leclercqii]|uniref:AAA family ATPase n=1 Tax=Candidatus Enterococcus leclercqii TaxID=1857218 RepID=UPI00137A76D0|nr:AAA family ATPase [Enterococcus sp. CU9D]KAF1290189.1 hypothetical protein BAU14_03235 [Enterococcus sp. CU9D]
MAKKYVQHFSTRIPWKDNGFTGKVDNNPKLNIAAQVIPNISDSRDLEFEETNKGKRYQDIGPIKMQSWITENAAFMSEEPMLLKMNHPYKKGNQKFKHFEETVFKAEPYSFLLRPFSWTLKDNAAEKSTRYHFYFDLDKTNSMLEWESAWVSHGGSQKGIFDYFFSGIQPNESLIFPYFKQVPFIDDNRKIIAGIGNLTQKVSIHEYETDGSSKEKNYIWETNATHSIRENSQQGFLMPYVEIAQYAKEHPEFDVGNVTIFEAEGFRDEFSYAAEWVSYDAAIDVLNQAQKVLHNLKPLKLKSIDEKWIDHQLEYVSSQLENVWKQRGVHPGLGAMLSAFKLKYGFDLAHFITGSEQNLLSELSLYFSGDKETGDDVLDEQFADYEDEYNGLLRNEEKSKFFELLCRINLNYGQAEYVWDKYKDNASEIIKNPYLLYELTRSEKDEHVVAISQIDNAMYLNGFITDTHPLGKPTKMRGEGDKRRFRAMSIFILSKAAEKGHTLLPYEQLIANIELLPLDRRTDFSSEKIDGLIDFLQLGDLVVFEDERYLKLKEYDEFKRCISSVTHARIEDSIENSTSWKDVINSNFGTLQQGNEENDASARKEKAIALSVLESSRISVLLGRAGTGKTAALGIFSSVEEISKGGILALTPTGKARVQLEKAFRNAGVTAEFMTVAQFLIRSNGFSWNTMTYKMPIKASSSVAKTVIIDESSMLTENMFAGILKLVDSHAERIIFIGDPNQLPPIGAGRPFVDLIDFLKKNRPNNIAELNTEMRQGSGGDDLSFAQLFSNSDDVSKDVVYKVKSGNSDNRLEFVQYKDQEELDSLLLNELVTITDMNDVNDIDGFNLSIGGSKNGQYTNYNTGENVEDWQILSPTKFIGLGSAYINDMIHRQYRQDIVDKWNQYPFSKNNPQSIQNIVFGDKVISNRNGDINYWDGSSGKSYISNGEIGIMSDYPSHYGKTDKNTSWYKFRFASFEGKVFSYTKNDFGGENSDSKLELAYALTVHKSQGSGFGRTIVIINGANSFVTKELLYTAFSRQKEKLIILSDLSVDELVQYSNDWYSDTKQRYTDLFDVPNIVEIEKNKKKRYFAENLIHKTSNGEMVRSKSEVIVADTLHRLGVTYSYEEQLKVGSSTYIPDFTLHYHGKVGYLEHLGMLGEKAYAEHWKKKKNDYYKHGISEEEGNLIVTQDELNGSIDSENIEAIITGWMES